MDDARTPRRRVLIGAYACGPGEESEANAGWEFAVAAARDHDVWVVTRERFRPWIEQALRSSPELAAHLTVIHLELPERWLRRKRSARDVYWYYAMWQHRLGRLARELHEQLHFDVAHHLTFAVDWLPCGLIALPRSVPLVWGPVGGSTYTPLKMLRWYAPRAAVGELARGVLTRTARRAFGDRTARRASLVVGQNPEVAERFGRRAESVVEPNAVMAPAAPRARTAGGRHAVFVGRLLAWKGPLLALHALVEPGAAGWTLDVYGSGPETPRLRAAIDALGLADRVRLMGQRPRSEVLAAYRDADAMLFPSMHDAASWAVGEASSVGCPVVCLDIGGPPVLAGPNGYPVRPGRGVVAGLAAALSRAGEHDGVAWDRWSRDRLPDLVTGWYERVNPDA